MKCRNSFIHAVPQVRVFASFDCERDEDLFRRLLAEGKNPKGNFQVFDRSMKLPSTPDCEAALRERIQNVDAVIVLCGVWTHRADNVTRELKIAMEEGKRYYLLKGRSFRECSRPTNATIEDKMYRWSKGTIDELVLRFH